MSNVDMLTSRATIRVVGVGGAGGNALNHMAHAGVGQVEFIAMNTDAQALERVQTGQRMHLGEQATRGLGAGGDPAKGERAAEESAEMIAASLAGADLVFIALGLGGGTGTGAGPVVARIARRSGALVVGVATLPFSFEGRKRSQSAMAGLRLLREQVDTLITIPNDRLLDTADVECSLKGAFAMADDVLRRGVTGIADLVTIPGLINLDFADLRAIIDGAGTALMAIGEAEGPDRARVAARQALSNPLLDIDVTGARGIIFNVTGGDDLTLAEVRVVAEVINSAAHPDATVIFGALASEEHAGRVRVTVVATGFSSQPTPEQPREIPQAAFIPETYGSSYPGYLPQHAPYQPAANYLLDPRPTVPLNSQRMNPTPEAMPAESFSPQPTYNERHIRTALPDPALWLNGDDEMPGVPNPRPAWDASSPGTMSEPTLAETPGTHNNEMFLRRLWKR